MSDAAERICICKSCGSEFTARQNNPNTVPKYCDVCKVAHHKCPTCGNWVGVDKIHCNPTCAGKDTSNIKVAEGHKRQAAAMTGEVNPAKRPDVREKISKGVKASYTPELRSVRRENLEGREVPGGKYDDGKGVLLKSLLELDIARFLQTFKLEYEYEKVLELPSRTFRPDFTLPQGTIIEVAGWVSSKESIKMYKDRFRIIMAESGKPLVVVTYGEMAYAFSNLTLEGSIDIVSIDDKEPRLLTVNLNNIGTIDYSHTLPFHEGKCNRVHSHLSQIISVGVTGVIDPVKYMVIDFGDLKRIAREVADLFDHKFVVGEKYAGASKISDHTVIRYDTEKGSHYLELPKEEVAIVKGEATIENMVEVYTNKLFEALPPNVVEVTVEMSEGIGKSAAYSVGWGNLRLHKMEDLANILYYHEWLLKETKETPDSCAEWRRE